MVANLHVQIRDRSAFKNFETSAIDYSTLVEQCSKYSFKKLQKWPGIAIAPCAQLLRLFDLSHGHLAHLFSDNVGFLNSDCVGVPLVTIGKRFKAGNRGQWKTRRGYV